LFAWVTVSEGLEVVWVLVVAQTVIPGVVLAGVAAIVGSDVAFARAGSGCKGRGWGVSRNAVDWFGSECHRMRGAGGCFKARAEVVVAVVDDVGIIDGGCAAVVSSDVVMARGVSGCGMGG
jgi:hypothetical protein